MTWSFCREVCASSMVTTMRFRTAITSTSFWVGDSSGEDVIVVDIADAGVEGGAADADVE